MNESNDDRLLKACKALVERLTAHLPRDTDEQKQALLQLAVALEQAFLAGVTAQREIEETGRYNPQRLTGDWAQSVPTVRLPQNTPEVLAAPGSAPDNCPQCSKPMTPAFVTPDGYRCLTCATQAKQHPLKVVKND